MSEYGDAIDDLLTEDQSVFSQSATAQAVAGVDGDPDTAARAIQLSRATRVPAPVIHGDIENFEKRSKSNLVGDIVRNSPALQKYINGYPLAPQVSNDDWHNLDPLHRAVNRIFGSTMDAAVEGFKEGFGEGDLGPSETGIKQLAEYLGPVGGAVEGLRKSPPGRALEANVYSTNLFMRTLSGAIHGAAKGGGALGGEMGLDPDRVEREIGSMLEWAINRGDINLGKAMPKPDPRQVRQVISEAAPYLNAGEVPPPGVNMWLDQIKVMQAAEDLDRLRDAQKAAGKSLTRERSPDAAEAFLNGDFEKRTLGINSDAVRELYKDKPPLPDDGLLGWVPDLADQLRLTEHSGGDISVPLSGWLARMEPEVAKQLEEHVRVRPEGMTVAEADVFKKLDGDPMLRPEPPTLEGKVQREASLEPLAQVGRRDVRLERASSEIDKFGQTFDTFKITEEGKSVGTVTINETPKGVLYIENIAAKGPNAIGVHAVRSIMEELRREYPNATKVGGYRVSGAREKAAKESWVEATLETSQRGLEKLAEVLADVGGFKEEAPKLGALRQEMAPGDFIEYRPTELYTAKEKEIHSAVREVIDRIAPGLEVRTVDKIEGTGQGTAPGAQLQGAFYAKEANYDPLVLVALNSKDGYKSVSTALHESIHHLADGFFTEGEWLSLERAAIDGDWINRHKINERYPTGEAKLKIEEAIADEFSLWARGGILRNAQLSPAVVSLFEKIKKFFDDIAKSVRQVLGREQDAADIFERVLSGEVGTRQPREVPFRQMLAQATEVEEAKMFERGAAMGMTQAGFKRLLAKMEEQRAETEVRAKARAERAVAVTKTEQWKENAPRVRREVTDVVNARPDVMADEYFRKGLINGEQVRRVKLDERYVSPEQRAILGEGLLSEKGVNPSDVAGVFGFVSGEAMVASLTSIKAARDEAGLTMQAYKNRLVKEQFDSTMMKRYGVPEHDRMLREAREDVITETAMDMIAEETLALATKAGQPPPFSKGQMKAFVKQEFDRSSIARAKNMEAHLRDAGRAGRAAEEALLKDDFYEAFRQKQRQYISILLADQAKKFGKEMDRFDALVKRLSPREVKGLEPEFADFIQKLMSDAGLPVKRSPMELQEAIGRSTYKDLDSFIESKNGDGWEMDVPDYIRQGQPPKYGDAMGVKEFRELRDSLQSMNHVGREVRQIEVMGTKRDFEEFKKEVLENIRQLPPRDKNKTPRLPFRFDAEYGRMEEFVKDLDLRQELGPLWNAMIHPMMDAKHTEYSLTEKLVKRLHEVEGFRKDWQKTLRDDIPQDFLIDPWDKTPVDLTREGMINIMLNWGNRSNIEKFTKGWGGKDGAAMLERQLRELIDRNASKEDWQFVQHMWDTFEEWKKPAGDMYHDLSGVAPKWIEAEPLTTPHGNFRGGYFPVIYDRLRSNINVIEEGAKSTNARFGGDYTRATVANHYAKERTGYSDIIQIDNTMEQVASRMQQMMHDISYRRAVVNVDKVIRDREIRGAIRKHYGPEYEAQLNPWIDDIANHFNLNEKAVSMTNSVLRRARFNLITHALGFNFKVIFSPSVGRGNPLDVANVMRDLSGNTALAYEKSKEIPHTFRNMDRDFRERLEQTITQNKWNDWQAKAMRASFWPTVKVEQGFRVITFVTEYQKAIEKGMSEGEAGAIADSYVRERHGSAGLPDMPAIMRSSEAMKMATMFYGYFSTMYNWQRQLPGHVRRGEWNKAMENLWPTLVIPTLLNLAFFTGAKEDDGWFKRIAKAAVQVPLGNIIFVRDFASALTEGFKPTTPLGSAIGAMMSIASDGIKKAEGKVIEKPIAHIGNVIGLSTGLPLGQISRSGQFMYDVKTGKQHPRNIWEYARGFVFGEAQLKKGR